MRIGVVAGNGDGASVGSSPAMVGQSFWSSIQTGSMLLGRRGVLHLL